MSVSRVREHILSHCLLSWERNHIWRGEWEWLSKGGGFQVQPSRIGCMFLVLGGLGTVLQARGEK